VYRWCRIARYVLYSTTSFHRYFKSPKPRQKASWIILFMYVASLHTTLLTNTHSNINIHTDTLTLPEFTNTLALNIKVAPTLTYSYPYSQAHLTSTHTQFLNPHLHALILWTHTHAHLTEPVIVSHTIYKFTKLRI
jgi:hypothetical protein